MGERKLNDSWTWLGSKLPNRLFLAPMAGYTASPFRDIAAEEGAAYLTTELCSARGVVYDSEFIRNARYLNPGSFPSRTAIQLFGSDPDDFEKAIDRLCQDPVFGACASFDINMGCPVPKVVKTGAGAALMRNPSLAAHIVERSRRSAERYGKGVSVKFRSGWSENELTAPSFLRTLEEAGAGGFCLHARTREQFYSGQADHGVTRACLEVTRLPLVANGDVSSLEEAESLLQMGASAVMIGRAAIGNPWIFSKLLALSEGRECPALNADSWMRTVERELDGLVGELGLPRGVREFRSALSAYIKGFPGAAAFRREIMSIEDPELLKAHIRQFAEKNFSTLNN